MVTKYLFRRQREKYKRIKVTLGTLVTLGSLRESAEQKFSSWNLYKKTSRNESLAEIEIIVCFILYDCIIFSHRNTTTSSKSHSNIITRRLIFVVKVPHDTIIEWYVCDDKVRVLRDNMYFLDLRLIFWFKPYDILSPGNEKWRCYINLWRTKVLMSLSL